MIYLYAADIRYLEDPKVHPELLQSLDEDTNKKITDCTNSAGRIEALGVYLLLKESFSRHQISAEKMNGSDHKSIHFTFSSSKNMMVCALGETQLGCSIRKVENVPKKIPVQFFS